MLYNSGGQEVRKENSREADFSSKEGICELSPHTHTKTLNEKYMSSYNFAVLCITKRVKC